MAIKYFAEYAVSNWLNGNKNVSKLPNGKFGILQTPYDRIKNLRHNSPIMTWDFVKKNYFIVESALKLAEKMKIGEVIELSKSGLVTTCLVRLSDVKVRAYWDADEKLIAAKKNQTTIEEKIIAATVELQNELEKTKREIVSHHFHMEEHKSTLFSCPIAKLIKRKARPIRTIPVGQPAPSTGTI